jgi:hypothetical protein
VKHHIRNERGHSLCRYGEDFVFARTLDEVDCSVCRHRLWKWGCEEEVGRAVVALIERGEEAFAREILLFARDGDKTVLQRIGDAHVTFAERSEKLRRAYAKGATVIHGRTPARRRRP